MSVVTHFANSNAVVTTGWSSPTNAYADDTSFATAAPGKNASITSDFGFAVFSDAEIPVGSTINSVTLEILDKSSTTGSTGSVIGLQGNVNGSLQGTEATQGMNLSEQTLTKALTGLTEANLKAAGYVKARVRGARASSNTAITWSLDYAKVTVDYTYVENHNGGVTGTGGGVIVEAGSKQGKVSGTFTGGGVTVQAHTASHNASLTATGGGVLTEVGAPGQTGIFAATGAGVLTWDYQAALLIEEHSGSFAATGGGVVASAAKTDRTEALTATGGGVAAAAAKTDRLEPLTATGAGAWTQTQSTDHPGAFVATGSGAASASVLAGRQLAAAFSGGGVLVELDTTARSVAIGASGAGVLSWEATQETPPEAHQGSWAATGGGVASLGASTARRVGVQASVSGRVSVSVQSARYLAALFTGGGTFGADWTGAHYGEWDATGGGVIVVGPGRAFPYGARASLSGPHYHVTVRRSSPSTVAMSPSDSGTVWREPLTATVRRVL